MSSSCCMTQSTRLVASSSYRARKSRTLPKFHNNSNSSSSSSSSSSSISSSSSNSSNNSSISSNIIVGPTTSAGSFTQAMVGSWTRPASSSVAGITNALGQCSTRRLSSASKDLGRQYGIVLESPIIIPQSSKHASKRLTVAKTSSKHMPTLQHTNSTNLGIKKMNRYYYCLQYLRLRGYGHGRGRRQWLAEGIMDESRKRKELSMMLACSAFMIMSVSSSSDNNNINPLTSPGLYLPLFANHSRTPLSDVTTTTTTTTSSTMTTHCEPQEQKTNRRKPPSRKITVPFILVNKDDAKNDVKAVEADARKNPYLVSDGIFQGARWTMEDTYKIENGGRFVAVFDGHGGAEVSTILQERLYDLYSEELVKKHWEGQNEFGAERKTIPSKSSHIAALQRGLEQIEAAVMKLDDLVYQGSTAVCVVMHEAKDGRRTLLTANIGDSRAILCRDGEAVDLTRDHKPGDEQEKNRIEAMGEEIEWDPYGQVFRVRDLSLSRAVGDRFAKPIVSSEPEIMTFPIIDKKDEYVVLASDGLWDVMSSQDVVEYVQEIFDSDIQNYSHNDKQKNMAKILANEALERGSADNVCVIVVWLKH